VAGKRLHSYNNFGTAFKFGRLFERHQELRGKKKKKEAFKFDESSNSGVDGEPETYFASQTPKKRKLKQPRQNNDINRRSIANFIDSSESENELR